MSARRNVVTFNSSDTLRRRKEGLPVRMLADFQHAGRVDRRFGIHDRFGRELGARAIFSDAVVVEGDRGGSSLVDIGIDAGTKVYAFRPQATRAGIAYGPRQSARYFFSMEARASAVEEYFMRAARNAKRRGGIDAARSAA